MRAGDGSARRRRVVPRARARAAEATQSFLDAPGVAAAGPAATLRMSTGERAQRAVFTLPRHARRRCVRPAVSPVVSDASAADDAATFDKVLSLRKPRSDQHFIAWLCSATKHR